MDFLTAYKKLEEVCRDINLDIKDLADTLNPIDTNKLNICRQMRNFVTHNTSQKFLSFTKDQITFIEDLTKTIATKDDLCSNHLNKKINLFSCNEFEKNKDVIERMAKAKVNEFVVFTNRKKFPDNIIGVIDIYELSQSLCFSKTKKIKDLIKKNGKNNIEIIDKNNKYQQYSGDVCDKIILCYSEKGKTKTLVGKLK